MKINNFRRCLSAFVVSCGFTLFCIHASDATLAQNERILPLQLPGPNRSSAQPSQSTSSSLPPALSSAGSPGNSSSLSSPSNQTSDQIAAGDQRSPLQPALGQEMPNGLSNSQVLSSGIARLELCTVRLIQKIELPANEAGPLAELLVSEGLAVNQGQIIAKVDDERARTELSVAAAKMEASQLKIQSDIEIRYAQAGYDAAAKKFERESRLARKGAGTESEADEARLQAIQAQLQIEKARHDYSVDQKSITVEKLQVLQAKELLRRHSVTAPWGGIIRKIFTHQGEWVNAGDPIVEMIQMDRLWVEGLVNLNQINPYQVPKRPVEVTMKLADGEKITFQGKIVLVDPEINGRNFKVKAEVSNRMFQDHWLLIPGMKVDMDIDLLPVGAVDKLGQQNFQPRG